MAGKKGVGASAPTRINVVNAEALKVGPDEVLIVRITDQGEYTESLVEGFLDELTALGLEERALVVVGDAELAVVKKDG